MWLTPICKLIIGQITPFVKRLLGIAFAFAGRRCKPLGHSLSADNLSIHDLAGYRLRKREE
jgi:hypothetical protein